MYQEERVYQILELLKKENISDAERSEYARIIENTAEPARKFPQLVLAVCVSQKKIISQETMKTVSK